jgi:plastocyanin
MNMLANKSQIILVAFVVTSTLAMLTCFNTANAKTQENSAKIVAAGGGNSTSPLTAFVPDNIEIKAGESVTWDNPTPVSEPHSVTFMKDNNSFPAFAAPFHVPSSTEFQSLDPNTNAEPLFVPVPGESPQTKTVVTVNARAFIPVVIDSTGKNVTYLQPNSNYNMDGTESYVNSGWLWPEGQAPPGGPPITKFTVTFEKPGTYSYVCNVHPWMTGSVTVK